MDSNPIQFRYVPYNFASCQQTPLSQSLNEESKQLYELFKRSQAPSFIGKYKLHRSSHYQRFASRFHYLHNNDRLKELNEIIEKDKAGMDDGLYKKVKLIFERHIISSEIKDPLIYFNDADLCIELGYGNKELSLIFPGLIEECNNLYNIKDVYYSKTVRDKFDDTFLNYHYRKQLNREREALEKRYGQRSKVPPVKVGPKLSVPINEDSMINDYLSRHQGFVVGEVHNQHSPKELLIDRMSIFKQYGVTAIYFEHLLLSHQAMLDEYYSSPIDTPMPLALRLYLEGLDKERGVPPQSGFKRVVEAAKNNSIRVIAIDTDFTYSQHLDYTGLRFGNRSAFDRCRYMNTRLEQLVAAHPKEEKYIVFCGMAHITTYCGALGVSQLLGIPNIAVCDHEEEKFYTGNELKLCEGGEMDDEKTVWSGASEGTNSLHKQRLDDKIQRVNIRKFLPEIPSDKEIEFDLLYYRKPGVFQNSK